MAIKRYMRKGPGSGAVEQPWPEMIALIFSGTSARWVSDVQFDGTCGSIPAGAGEEGCDARRRTP
jgi:hypothetical protein